MSQVLRLDASGHPQGWNTCREAAILFARDGVLWTLGEPFRVLHGGRSALTGELSELPMYPIIAASGMHTKKLHTYVPRFSKMAVYRRDQGICLYCGNSLHIRESTLDHVTPVSQGGRTKFDNIVLSCLGCNRHKRNRTPEEAGMELLALPYTPNLYENLILGAKHQVLADQMEFLLNRVGKNSRLLTI